MREKLNKIFGVCGVLEEKGVVPEVKEEELYNVVPRGKNNTSRGSFQCKYRSTYRGGSRGGAKVNVIRWQGNVIRCFECDSTKHIVSDCPHRQKTEDVNLNVHITLFNSGPGGAQKKLLIETLCLTAGAQRLLPEKSGLMSI